MQDTILLWLKNNSNYNVVQDSINNTFDAILILKTINRVYNINGPRNKSQKNTDANVEDYVHCRSEQVGKLF